MIDRIKKLMDYKKLSATQFSDEIEIQRSSLSHVLSGRNKPSLDFMLKIKHTFPEIELDWLLLGEGTMIKKAADTLTPGQKGLSVSDINPEIDFEQDRMKEKQVKEPVKTESDKSSVSRSNAAQSAKKPVRVMMFYADNTFESFDPEQ